MVVIPKERTEEIQALLRQPAPKEPEAIWVGVGFFAFVAAFSVTFTAFIPDPQPFQQIRQGFFVGSC